MIIRTQFYANSVDFIEITLHLMFLKPWQFCQVLPGWHLPFCLADGESQLLGVLPTALVL